MKDCCVECGQWVSPQVSDYSTDRWGIPLCVNHQNWVKMMLTQTTDETFGLYFALKMRGVPAEIEKFDGHKHIDIAVTDAKVNLEVDGGHHNYSPQQALSDLKRTFFSFKKGYLTLRIPNSLVRYHLDETADYIVDFLMENRDRQGR